MATLPLHASVAASKITRRAGASKNSAKLDAASAGDAVDIVQLLRTPSGTVRAKLSDGGWVTATTNGGKRLLVADVDLENLLESVPGAELEPEPEFEVDPEPEASAAGRQRRHTGKRKSLAWAPPQDDAGRAKALATGRDSAFDPGQAPWMQKCLLQCCKPLQLIGKNDWLAKGQPGDNNGDRNGQSFAQFCRPGPRRSFPSKHQKIHLTPIGEMQGAPDTTVLVECLTAHFQMEVVVEKPVLGRAFDALEKDEWGYLETPSCHDLLAKRKPRNCFANIGFTMEPVCDTERGFEVLAGQARPDMGVGIFSFACYESKSPTQFLRRCCMVLVHEMTHLFGIKHCVHAACLMNGVNHLGEADRRPFAICPVCVAKFRECMRGVWPARQHKDIEDEDPLIVRERHILKFLEGHGLDKDAQLCHERLQVIAEMTSSRFPDMFGAT
eukprot:SAG31_NODE_1754_length_7344_cov_20.426639_6_plen_441_part_00